MTCDEIKGYQWLYSYKNQATQGKYYPADIPSTQAKNTELCRTKGGNLPSQTGKATQPN